MHRRKQCEPAKHRWQWQKLRDSLARQPHPQYRRATLTWQRSLTMVTPAQSRTIEVAVNSLVQKLASDEVSEWVFRHVNAIE